METPPLDNGTTVKDVPPGGDRISVELPNVIEEPFDAVDKSLAEDVV